MQTRCSCLVLCKYTISGLPYPGLCSGSCQAADKRSRAVVSDILKPTAPVLFLREFEGEQDVTAGYFGN